VKVFAEYWRSQLLAEMQREIKLSEELVGRSSI
jgi:hypothetical protein